MSEEKTFLELERERLLKSLELFDEMASPWREIFKEKEDDDKA